MKTTQTIFMALLAVSFLSTKTGLCQSHAYHFQPVTTISPQYAGELIERINGFVESHVVCRFSVSSNELVVLSQKELDVAEVLDFLENSGDYVADLDKLAFPTDEVKGPDFYSLQSVKQRWYEANRFKLNLGIQTDVMLLTALESRKMPSDRLELLLSENKAVIID